MSITVTATPTGGSGNLLRVLVLTAATESGGQSAHAAPTGSTISVTPNFSNSFIVWSIDDRNSATSMTAFTNNTLLDNVALSGARLGSGYYSGTVTSGTAVTCGLVNVDGSSGYFNAAYEVPASGGSTPSIDASSPAAVSHTTGTTACTTASFTPPAGAVVVAIVNGSGFPTAWTVTDSSGMTWTKRVDSTEGQQVWTATVPSGGTTNGTAALTAAGSLTAAATQTIPGAAALTAAASMSAAATQTTHGAAALTAASGLSAAPSAPTQGAAALAASSGLSAAGTQTIRAAASLTAASSLSAASSSVVNVVGSWRNARSATAAFDFPFPSCRPVQVAVANVAGDWMFAMVTWRQPVAGAGATVTVADDVHNYWEPVGAPSGDSSVAGVTRTAIWVAPAARAASFVQAAATGPVAGLAVTVIDVAGLSKWYSLTAITPGSAAATSLSLGIGAPSSSAFVLAAAGSDNLADTISGPGGGWTSLTSVSSNNGVDHTGDIQLNSAWQVTSGSATAAWSSTGSLDFSGVTMGVLVSAPAPSQVNPNWPVTVTEFAPGAGFMTPPSQTTWVPLTARSLSMSVTQGRQYTMGELQAAQGTLSIDNPDGALIPPGMGSFAGLDSGTPVRQRMIIPAASTPYYVPFSGFFQRWPFQLDADTLRGQTQATILDAWAYGAGTLDSMLREELKLDNPYALWMLDDPAGSTAGANLAPGNQNPLVLTTSKNGAGGATEAFGANDGALIGDSSAQVTTSGLGGGSSGMWSQTLAGTSSQSNGYGYALVCADSGYPPVSGGVTIEAWFQLTNPVATFSAAVSGNKFTSSGTYTNGTAVTLSSASGFSFPGGFSTFTVYYVISASGNTFSLANNPGGGAVTVSSAGSGFMIATTPWKSVIWSARNVLGPVVEIDVDPANGDLLLLYKPQGGTDTTVIINSALDFRSNGLTHVAVTFTQTAYKVIIDGGGFAGGSGTFSAPLAASFTEMDIGGLTSSRTGGSVQGYAWTGYSSTLVIYPAQLSQNRILNHYWAAIAGMKNEAACDRIERILEYTGLTGRRCLLQQSVPFEGDLCVSGQDIGGQPAASSITNIAASTLPAMMYVAPTGDLFYLSKLHAWNNPVKWVLGDNTAAGEIPYLPSYATDYDPSRVVNDIQLTQLDTQLVTVPSAAALEAASRAQYGDVPYQVTAYLEFDDSSAYNQGGGLNDLVDWLAYAYSKPQNRVQSVTVEPASHPSAWQFAAGASVGDMVTVNLRPPTMAGVVISVTTRVTQTTRSLQYSQDGVTGAVQCVLDSALEENCLTCDDAVRGLLSGSNVIGW